MIITVTDFNDKSTSPEKIWYAVTDEKKRVHNLFSSLIPDLASKRDILNIGLTVKFTKIKDVTNPGKNWWNVIDVEAATATQAVQEDKSGSFATENIRQKSIERQSCLGRAVDLYSCCEDVSLVKILNTAEIFYDWLKDGIIPVDQGIVPPVPPNTTPAPLQREISTVGKIPNDVASVSKIVTVTKEELKEAQSFEQMDAAAPDYAADEKLYGVVLKDKMRILGWMNKAGTAYDTTKLNQFIQDAGVFPGVTRHQDIPPHMRNSLIFLLGEVTKKAQK